MAELDENLDLLDLEESNDLDNLPETSPFTNSKPKKPWLLLGVGILIIALATYIIIKSVVSDSDSSVDIDLDTPEATTDDVAQADNASAPMIVPDNAAAVPVVVAPQPDVSGVPVREVEDRKDVKFNPNKQDAKPIAPVHSEKTIKVKENKVIKQNEKPAPAKPRVSAGAGNCYVQFGSYGTRAAAEVAQKKIRATHNGLFDGKQFVVLAAVLPNGTTTYRLRVAFPTSAEANGFCRNAKSDGLDCYVAK